MKQLLRVLLVLTLVLAMAAPAFAEPDLTAAADSTVVAEGEFVESIPEKPELDPDDIEPEKPGKGDDEQYGELGDGDVPGGDKNLGDGSGSGEPKTGDESNPVLWGALCLAALAGLVGMFKARKRS